MRLNKNTLKNVKRKSKILEIKEYDLEVELYAMSLKEQLEVEKKSEQDKNLFIAQVLLNCCMDGEGGKLFTNTAEIEELPADLTLVIFKECLSINSLGEKDVENLAKNS